ncbi:hypothetical protein [Burkholderia sp. BDU5]|uniref:hypothetical protein n=1 Tax=Burkholderia sp. BDU5 TaxID=1385590 RepID=UPI00075E6AB7|nr:hypothetical protein [Burkholderia sp. BDU5]KVE35712.1 hypothetical protein WS69_13760 [Burkholderia sp. BDU5]
MKAIVEFGVRGERCTQFVCPTTRAASELASDCDMIKRDATWPNNCIDWERAARELQVDYSSVEFDGVTYWYR